MRVITGSARGKRLETLPGDDITRPTAERVKEALFSAIQFDIEGRRVLDLFAGSGQLGIEALSRGASGAVFVDRNAAAAAVVQKNVRAAGFFPQSQVLCTDALGYLAHPKDRFGLSASRPNGGRPASGDRGDRDGGMRRRHSAARADRRACSGEAVSLRPRQPV